MNQQPRMLAMPVPLAQQLHDYIRLSTSPQPVSVAVELIAALQQLQPVPEQPPQKPADTKLVPED